MNERPPASPAAFFLPRGSGRFQRLVLAACLAALLSGCQPAERETVSAAADPAPAADPSQGKWRAARTADVQALPYLQGYKTAEDRPTIVEHDPAAAFDGLNFYVSGHAAEAVLIDMQGRVLHRWRYPLRRLWPDLAKDPGMKKLEYWRRAYLYPNGDLLGIYEGQGIVKLDARSKVLWAHRGGIHHDLSILPNGDIWVLDREGKILPRINPEKGVLEDMVTVLGARGRVKRKSSLLEAFERSPYASLLKTMAREGDIFHTNTLEVLDGRFADRDPAFKKGNVLVSVLKLDTLAILDPDREEIVWARTGPWRRQHQPTFLDNGHLLLFDNLGAGRTRSRVLEIDPLIGETVWQYGGTAGVDFLSKTLGSCQRLPNGNTLLTESENGRAIEVTPEGRIVWELYNPHRAGEKKELVAVLFEVVRLPPDFPFQGAGNR